MNLKDYIFVIRYKKKGSGKIFISTFNILMKALKIIYFV